MTPTTAKRRDSRVPLSERSGSIPARHGPRALTSRGSRGLPPALIAVLLVACGGGGGGDEDEELDLDADATGIWTGTDQRDGGSSVAATVVIAPEGRFGSISASALFSGDGTTTGNILSADATGFSGAQGVFGNGNTSGAFSFSGTVTEGSALSATYSGAATSGRLTLSYDNSQSNRPASLGTLSGVYSTSTASATASITSTGTLTFNASTGTNCMGSGSIAVPDFTRNVYTWTLTLTGCVNNGTAQGVGYLRDVSGGTNNSLVLLGAVGNFAPFVFNGTK